MHAHGPTHPACLPATSPTKQATIYQDRSPHTATLKPKTDTPTRQSMNQSIKRQEVVLRKVGEREETPLWRNVRPSSGGDDSAPAGAAAPARRGGGGKVWMCVYAWGVGGKGPPRGCWLKQILKSNPSLPARRRQTSSSSSGRKSSSGGSGSQSPLQKLAKLEEQKQARSSPSPCCVPLPAQCPVPQWAAQPHSPPLPS